MFVKADKYRLCPAALVLPGICLVTPAHAQISCTIIDMTMMCPNGVIVQNIGASVLFGGKSFAPGAGDRKTLDGRDIYDLGNKGILLGGATQAERVAPAPPTRQ